MDVIGHDSSTLCDVDCLFVIYLILFFSMFFYVWIFASFEYIKSYSSLLFMDYLNSNTFICLHEYRYHIFFTKHVPTK